MENNGGNRRRAAPLYRPDNAERIPPAAKRIIEKTMKITMATAHHFVVIFFFAMNLYF